MPSGNPEAQPRYVVKVSKATAPFTVELRGIGDRRRQFRKTTTLPRAIADAVKENGEAFAVSPIDRYGRWYLERLAGP
jgi:hypothetical protein